MSFMQPFIFSKVLVILFGLHFGFFLGTLAGFSSSISWNFLFGVKIWPILGLALLFVSFLLGLALLCILGELAGSAWLVG